MDGAYTVTTFERTPRRVSGNKVISDHRTVGIFRSFEDAEWVVLNNAGDIEEAGWYQFAVIEYVPFGLYALERTQVWYEFLCGDVNRWNRIVGPPAALVNQLGTDKIYNWSNIG